MGKPGLAAQLWFPTKQLGCHSGICGFPLSIFLEGGWASRSKETQKQLKQNCEVLRSCRATGKDRVTADWAAGTRESYFGE